MRDTIHFSFPETWFCICFIFAPLPYLIDLLLLVNAVFARSAVNQQEESTNDRENLEEIVLREVFVGVVLVELESHQHYPWRSWVKLTVQKLLTSRLKTLNITTSMIALNLALKPTTTITQATNPKRATITLQMLHLPLKTKPTNKKIKRTRPASWKYILRSFSSIDGRPAKALDFRTQESDRTIKRPPITDKFRRKKLRSKMSPYPSACVTTTPMSRIAKCTSNLLVVFF